MKQFTRISILLAVVCLIHTEVRAGVEMARVTGIVDGRTIRVSTGGRTEQIRLSGLRIVDEIRARDLLTWTIGDSWVMLECGSERTCRVYRSPDALFVNRELVNREYAHPTEPGIASPSSISVTYVGVVNPSGPQAGSSAASSSPRVSKGSGAQTGSGKGRRSRGSRSPAPRSRSGGGS